MPLFSIDNSEVYYLSTTAYIYYSSIIYTTIYYSTSTSWQRRGFKRVPRSDLDQLIQHAFLSTFDGTILHIKP